jgi:hypothetical protein
MIYLTERGNIELPLCQDVLKCQLTELRIKAQNQNKISNTAVYILSLVLPTFSIVRGTATFLIMMTDRYFVMLYRLPKRNKGFIRKKVIPVLHASHLSYTYSYRLDTGTYCFIKPENFW